MPCYESDPLKLIKYLRRVLIVLCKQIPSKVWPLVNLINPISKDLRRALSRWAPDTGKMRSCLTFRKELVSIISWGCPVKHLSCWHPIGNWGISKGGGEICPVSTLPAAVISQEGNACHNCWKPEKKLVKAKKPSLSRKTIWNKPTTAYFSHT